MNMSTIIDKMLHNKNSVFVVFATNIQEDFMRIEDLDLGDVVFAAHHIINDGSMPECQEGEILAEAGARGVIVMKGHIEEDENRFVFLVRFEDAELNLGRPVGCWSEDLLCAQTLN